MRIKRRNTKMRVSSIAAKAGMSEKTARKYIRSGQLPLNFKEARMHRTRIDSFEGHQELIEQTVLKSPGLQAKSLLCYMMEQYPNIYQDRHLR